MGIINNGTNKEFNSFNDTNSSNTINKNSTLGGVVSASQKATQEIVNNYQQASRTVIEEIMDLDSIFLNNQTSNITNGFSSNNYSDKDNIYINKLSDVMTKLQNELGPEYYAIFSEYITGKQLGEIVDENGIILLTDKKLLEEILNKNSITEDVNIISDEINKILNENKDAIDFSKLSENMLASTIEEVVTTTSSFDAIVLKNTEGNYVIVDSCTNAQSTNDIYAIAYTLAKQIVGDDELVSLVIEQILPALNNETINSSDYYLDLVNNGGIEYLEQIYNQQIQDNIALIEKYAEKSKEEGTQIQLNGYSLGGGLQLTAYSMLCSTNPEIEQYIESVSVYNPFISYMEQNPMNEEESFFSNLFDKDDNTKWYETITNPLKGRNKENQLIDYLASSEKVRIYSGEEDYISTFNNCLYDLKDRITFIKTEDIEKGEISDISEIYSVILGNKANHNFRVIELDSFDEHGNIKEPGEYISISDSLAKAAGEEESPLAHLFSTITDAIGFDSTKNDYEIDYNDIIKSTLNLAHLESLIGDVPEAQPIIDELTIYLEDNVGNYTYEGIAQALTEGVWDVVGDKIDSEIPKMVENWANENLSKYVNEDILKYGTDFVSELGVSIVNTYKDKSAFEDALNGFLTSEENKEYVISLLSNLNNGDYIKAYFNINTLMSNFEDSFEVEYSDVGQESINVFGKELEYTNVIEQGINTIIKDEILNIVDQLVDDQISQAISSATSNIDIGNILTNPFD